MKVLTRADWEALPSRAYAAWFNTLQGMRSPVLIGTRSAAGQDNVAIFNSLTHIGARPPLLAFVVRPLTVERHTYENIKATGSFTISHVSASIVERAHHTSAKYAAGVSEFAAVGLTPKQLSGTHAPYVAEAEVAMHLAFAEEHHIAANDTTLVVGRVTHLCVPDAVAARAAEGGMKWDSLDPVVVSGLYDYYRTTYLRTLPYAKPQAANGVAS